MTELLYKSLSLQVDEQQLLQNVTVSFRPGKLTVILGANGAGKTSLLKVGVGLATGVLSGSCLLDGVPPADMSSTERALKLAYLPQSRPMAWPLTVRDTVALGRFAHGAVPGRLKQTDSEAINQAIVDCDLSGFTARRTDTLSGGELARVHCARAFAAHAPLLLADEPVSALDPKHQHMIMQLLRSYVVGGAGAVVVLHDPALAAQYADRLIWMKQGCIVDEGDVKKTMTVERLRDVYAVDSRVWQEDERTLIDISGITGSILM